MIYQNRRQLLTASVATMAASGMLAGKGVHAAPKILDIEPRGQRGIFERLQDLNLESYQDFIKGVRQWSNFYGLVNASKARSEQLMKEQGLDEDQVGKLTFAQLMPMLDKDPTINLYGRAWLDGQWYKFKTLQDAFHARSDIYFDEMEANDKVGPGKLELNPTMHIPDYTKHEIHTQLGGYVGDPFAGYIYLYDVLVLNDGRNEQDVNHIASANRVPVPKDGKVKRILDYGTGVGQLATALKARFPEAEVWGIDVGGPMVRYAHVKANDMNNGANFRQALAEDTGFPDNYFDIVTTNIVHHEVTADASKAIFKESHRIVRPGGVYYPMDLYTNGPPPRGAFRQLVDYLTLRWNHEDWWMEWQELDRIAEMKKVGLIVNENGPGSAMGGMADPTSKNLVATKA